MLRLSASKLLFVLIPLFVPAPVALGAQITGSVAELSSQTIVLHIQGAPSSKASPLAIGLGFMPAVEIDDVNDSGIFERAAGINDLHVGEQVTVTVENGCAARIRIREPLEVRGILGRVQTDAIELQTSRPASRMSRLSIDRAHLRVAGALFDGGPRMQRLADDLRPGMMVSVINARGHAYSIDVAPPPPVVGIVESLDAARVTVRPAAPGGEAQRAFPVGPETRYFNNYFGEHPEPGTASDVHPGQPVSITALNGSPTIIVLSYPAALGRVTRIEGSRIYISSGQDSDPNPLVRLYEVNRTTKIYMGVAQLTRASPRGGTETLYDYLPGGTLDGIHVGDRVSIGAKRDTALSIRVTPTARQIAAVSALPIK